VTQPNGKVQARENHFLLPDGVPRPLPGSTVFVPDRDASQPGTAALLANISSAVQVLATLVALVVAVRH
jgi:hypothetical protein